MEQKCVFLQPQLLRNIDSLIQLLYIISFSDNATIIYWMKETNSCFLRMAKTVNIHVLSLVFSLRLWWPLMIYRFLQQLSYYNNYIKKWKCKKWYWYKAQGSRMNGVLTQNRYKLNLLTFWSRIEIEVYKKDCKTLLLVINNWGKILSSNVLNLRIPGLEIVYGLQSKTENDKDLNLGNL